MERKGRIWAKLYSIMGRPLGTCAITASRRTHLLRGCDFDRQTNATFVWDE